MQQLNKYNYGITSLTYFHFPPQKHLADCIKFLFRNSNKSSQKRELHMMMPSTNLEGIVLRVLVPKLFFIPEVCFWLIYSSIVDS